jgi:hypothetical protein
VCHPSTPLSGLVCYEVFLPKSLETRGDFGEFIDEGWKDIQYIWKDIYMFLLRLARIGVISLAEKRSNELISLIKCFTD